MAYLAVKADLVANDLSGMSIVFDGDADGYSARSVTESISPLP